MSNEKNSPPWGKNAIPLFQCLGPKKPSNLATKACQECYHKDPHTKCGKCGSTYLCSECVQIGWRERKEPLQEENAGATKIRLQIGWVNYKKMTRKEQQGYEMLLVCSKAHCIRCYSCWYSVPRPKGEEPPENAVYGKCIREMVFYSWREKA